eukprot:TRINITY_DN5552_c0_g1_i1.p1 TRINITY_DN5552_c0_g1~~TRINITY_DN5552_c0_g1_i1.p1  ORF type:complete len:236 (-),score=28.58 TRINITY_DN5552_c0_g1_i1:533-1240(-)
MALPVATIGINFATYIQTMNRFSYLENRNDDDEIDVLGSQINHINLMEAEIRDLTEQLMLLRQDLERSMEEQGDDEALYLSETSRDIFPSPVDTEMIRRTTADYKRVLSPGLYGPTADISPHSDNKESESSITSTNDDSEPSGLSSSLGKFGEFSFPVINFPSEEPIRRSSHAHTRDSPKDWDPSLPMVGDWYNQILAHFGRYVHRNLLPNSRTRIRKIWLSKHDSMSHKLTNSF